MSMKAMEDLRDKLCKELDEIARKPEMGAGDLELAHKLTDTIKNIDKITMLEESGYSQDGDWEMEGRGSYGRGASYAGRRRDSMGRCSREDGNYSSRLGRYSRGGGREKMMEHVRMAMESAPEEYKEDIRRFMREIENG